MTFQEPVSWDRNDIYWDRRPVKSELLRSSPLASRWNRDSPSFSYRGNHHGRGSRQFSHPAFTDYCGPPGCGRQQSNWPMFPEEMGYGYMPSRSCERVIEDKSYWTSSSSCVDRRYISETDCYNVRGYQKIWEEPNWQHNNSSTAVSDGNPFNCSPVVYGGKPCNGFSEMLVERRHNKMYPGFGTERDFNASPVICNRRPSNGFSGVSVEKSRNGYAPRNGFSPRNGFPPRNKLDRPFSLSSAVSGDKQCLGYSNPHVDKSQNRFFGPSVVKTHSRIKSNIEAERPNSLSTRTRNELSSSPVVKAYNRSSPHIAADRSNYISPDISIPSFAPVKAASEKTCNECSDICSEKTVDMCSSSVSAERLIKLSSDMSRDTTNPAVSGILVEKTPYNITSNLADSLYLKPSGTSVASRCNGLVKVLEEKPGNRVAGGSTPIFFDGIARSTFPDLPVVKNDVKLSNNKTASNCLRMVSENHLNQHHEIEVGVIIEPFNVPKHDKENFPGADCKPFIWARSGSLSSRGRSSSSRSIQVDSKATVDVSVQFKGTTDLCSPSGDAADFYTSSATSGESHALKKARLGWGQGLAKYEKKIVDDPCGNGTQEDVLSPNAGDKCTSPSTPTSATCSSSQDKDLKSSIKGNTPDHPKLGVSDNMPPSFEKLDVSLVRNEVHFLLNLVHSKDQCPTGSGSESANAMSKLLIWKTGILKAVELTYSELETLGSEIQSSKSENRTAINYQATSSLLDANGGTTSHSTITACSAMHMPLPVYSNPGTATSNAVVALCLVKATPQVENPRLYSEDVNTNGLHTVVKLTHSQEICRPGDSFDACISQHYSDNSSHSNPDMLDSEESRLHKFIFAANKEEAIKAYDELSHLLSKSGTSVVVCQESPYDTLIRVEVAKRMKLLRFTEKVITLKYRALQQLRKGSRLLEIRKKRPKFSKLLQLGTITSQYAHLKSNLLRSRVSYTEGSTRFAPLSQTVSLTSKLLYDCPKKVYKDELKLPPLILDKKEKQMSRFVSYNGLVEDPVTVEKERDVMNHWTPDEKKMFLGKFAKFGKNFRKIASYLDHKTTADCVEFYYKNHKSSIFERTRKKHIRRKTQSKSVAKYAYMLTAGEEKWDQERAAADVLAGRSDSLSSEAISQCVSSSFSHSDVHMQWKRKKVGGKRRPTWMQEVTVKAINDEMCSGESCGEMDFSSLDWTDEEKRLLLQAVKLYGNNFELVSKFVKTRYINECKTFYSKVKKLLGSTLTGTNIRTACIGLDSKPDIDVL